MKVIDIETKGNVIKLYLGKNNLKDYYGDDWNDRPYEHNAGPVYNQFVSQTAEVYVPFDNFVCKPGEDWTYRGNSPYCKEDFRDKGVPAVIIVPAKECEYAWDVCYSQYVLMDTTVKICYNDDITDLTERLGKIGCVVTKPKKNLVEGDY